MKSKTTGNLLVAVLAVSFLLPSCVSSKKYKTSQAALQQARNDSAVLAQQVASQNQNIQSMQQQNTDLKKSLEASNANYTTQQKTVVYYEDYFTKQEATLASFKQEVKDSLATYGVTEDALEQKDGSVYINLNENTVFKKNSVAVTKDGKKVITGLANTFKNHDDMMISVSNNSSIMPASGTTMENNATASSSSYAPAKRTHKTTGSTGAAAKNNSSSSTTGTNASAKATPMPAHKRIHRNYSSEAMASTYSNGVNWGSSAASRKRASAWLLKAGRVNTVAKGLLQNGLPKVNVTMENPNMVESTTTETGSGIRVKVTPKMKDFTPPAKAAVVTKE